MVFSSFIFTSISIFSFFLCICLGSDLIYTFMRQGRLCKKRCNFILQSLGKVSFFMNFWLWYPILEYSSFHKERFRCLHGFDGVDYTAMSWMLILLCQHYYIVNIVTLLQCAVIGTATGNWWGLWWRWCHRSSCYY